MSSIQRSQPEDEYFFPEGCYILELSNSDADADVSIARARVLPGVTTQWHSLRATAERYLILEGRGRVEIGEGAPADVGPGDVVIIPPDTAQRIHNLSAHDDLIFLAICSPRFTPDAYQSLPL